MKFTFNDGGREAAGFKGRTGDCVTRAIAIATGLPYSKVYDDLHGLIKKQKLVRLRSKSPRDGVHKRVYRPYLEKLGWTWVPTMHIGSGCKVHLRDGELPGGVVIVSVSKHMVTVIDGVIQDTYDPSRDGSRCVYGYFVKTS